MKLKYYPSTYHQAVAISFVKALRATTRLKNSASLRLVFSRKEFENVFTMRQDIFPLVEEAMSHDHDFWINQEPRLGFYIILLCVRRNQHYNSAESPE